MSPKRKLKNRPSTGRRSNESTDKVRSRRQASGDVHNQKSASRKWLFLILVIVLLGALGLLSTAWFQRKQLDRLGNELKSAERAGNWQRVEILAREWAAQRPQDYESWQAAADAALNLNRPDAAVQYLEAMPDGAPLNAYLQLGYLQMQVLQDPIATKATCDKTLQFYPTDSETHERLLYYYTMTGQRNAITQEAKRALRLGCDTLTTYAYLFGAKWLTFTNGYETNQRWLQKYPDSELFEVASVVHMPSYVFLDVLAQDSVAAGEEPRPLEYAAECVAELRNKYPQNLELLALETRNLCRAGQVELVAERLSLQLPGMADDNRFWRFKGWYLAQLERWQEALEAYQRALELEPFDWTSQLEIAAVLRATEGFEASATMQNRADTGKRLMMAVQKCPALHQLEPPSLYDDLESYFLLCEQEGLARQLRERRRER